MKKKILVVDDDESIRKFLKVVIENEGHEFIAAENGQEAIAMTYQHRPNLIVLDLALPDINGPTILIKIREWNSVPVIVLTANKNDDEKVELLDLGADDFLTKPFHAPELLARIRVAFRHIPRNEQSDLIKIGKLVIDVKQGTVKVNNDEVKLTAKEFEFLVLLARNPGRVLTQRQILKELWGPNFVEHTHYLRVYSAQIRKKLGPLINEKLIETISGVGLRFLLK